MLCLGVRLLFVYFYSRFIYAGDGYVLKVVPSMLFIGFPVAGLPLKIRFGEGITPEYTHRLSLNLDFNHA